MVEIEVRKSEVGTEKTVLDVKEIIGKARGFVDGIREMSVGGQPMAVSVEGFNFSVGKADGEYDLSLNMNLAFKPKEAAAKDVFVFFVEKLNLYHSM